MWGRPSPAADRPWALRPAAAASDSAVRADGGDGRVWIVRAANVSGTRHRGEGSGSDDAYAWRSSDDRLTVAVADGVGGRVGSAVTAAAAVVAAVNESEPLDAVGAANLAAGGARGPAGGGATTLVVATVVAREPAGPDAEVGATAVLARVGDSSAFVLTGATWREVWAPDPDDSTVHTGTRALPAERPVVERAEVDLAPGDTLVLVTDGVANPLRDGPTTVAPGLAAGLGGHPDPFDLARLLDFSRQGVHDDRTLLAVWCAPRPAG